MERFTKLARRLAALAPALLVMAAPSGLVRQASADPVGHHSLRPAASAPLVRIPTKAEIDTQENRQLALSLTSTFTTDIAKIYVDQGPTAAYMAATKPWEDQNLIAMIGQVPDSKLFVAVETIAELPSRAKWFLDDQVSTDTPKWDNRTSDQIRADNADYIIANAPHDAQSMMFGGALLKNDGIVDTNPDSFWETTSVPSIRLYYQGYPKQARSNLEALSIYLKAGGLGPNGTQIASAYFQQKRQPPTLSAQGPAAPQLVPASF